MIRPGCGTFPPSTQATNPDRYRSGFIVCVAMAAYSGHLASHLRSAAQLLIQSEFNVLKANLMAVPRIVAIFAVSARVQLDDPSSAAGFQS